MIRGILVALAAAVMVLSVACQPAKPPEVPAVATAPTAAEIQSRADAFAAALEAKNAETLAGMFTDDCLLMPDDLPALSGKAAVQAYYTKTFETVSQKGSIKVEETGGMGEIAFARGTGAFTVTPKAGNKPISLTLKWMSVSKRQPDGSWKIHRHIWNLDHPNPMTAR